MDKSDQLHIQEYERQLEAINCNEIKPWFDQSPAVVTTYKEALNVRKLSINNCISIIKSKQN